MARDRWQSWIVAAAYAVLAWLYCGAWTRGLYGETTFYELSQTRTWWQGFIYPYQATRPLVSVPYQLGYLLSNGSYSTMTALFVLSVFATGLLTYRLVRELAPGSTFLAFAAGAIAATHGADRLGTFVPAITVRQAVVCGLMAVVLFVIAFARRRRGLMAAAVASLAASLWTYEAGFLALAAAPLLVLPAARAERRRWLTWTAVWELVPAAYALVFVIDYLRHQATSYQASRVAQHLSITQVGANAMSIVFEGLAFWRWVLLWLQSQAAACAGYVGGQMLVPVVLGAVLVAGVAWGLQRQSDGRARIHLVKAIAGAAFFALLCAAPYSIVRNLWYEGGPLRTQLFLAAPAAVLLALVIGWIDQWNRAVATAALVVVVSAGVASGAIGQVEGQAKWRDYRQVMRGILNQAPKLKDESMVVLVGVPDAEFTSLCPARPPADPFGGDELWFNSAIQVLYPRLPLVGIYFTRDRRSPGSIQFDFDAQGAVLNHADVSVKATRFGYGQMVAFAYDAAAGARLLDRFPADAVPGSAASAEYRPMDRILPGPPPVETVRKLAE